KKDHRPTADYVRELRVQLTERFPEQTFFFLAPDISTQVLNFGLPAPIDVQVVGAVGNEQATYDVAKEIARGVLSIPGAVDVHLAQVPRQPALRVDVNRTMAGEVGLTERDVASDLLVALASSAVVSPSYWLDKVEEVVRRLKPSFPRGTTVRIKGQAESMQSSFRGLAFGLIFAILLVYLLMVVNFQSWLDPLVILMALPGALAGIAWILFLS